MTRRTLASSFLAALLLATQLVALTLALNPEVRLQDEWLSLARALFVPYLVVGWLGFAALAWLLATLRFWPSGLRRPVRALPWFTSLLLVVVGLATALGAANLWSYRYAIALPAVRGLAGNVALLGLVWLLLLGVCIDAWWFPFRSRRLAGGLVKVVYLVLLVAPFAARPRPFEARPPVQLAVAPVAAQRRVLLLGVDGLSPGWLRVSLERGTAPTLGRMLRRGAAGRLATLQPTEGPPVWATIFTGRYPRDHGVKSFAAYRLSGSARIYELLPRGALVRGLEALGTVTRVPLAPSTRRGPALWNAMNAFGLRAGVVRFWGTHPAEHVQGFMLSNAYHRLLERPELAGDVVYPPDLLSELRARLVDPFQSERALLAGFVDSSAPLPSGGAELERDLVRRALAPDLSYRRSGLALRAAYDPPFFATYIYGFDVAGHSFLRYAEPDRFGNVKADELRRYGKVLDRYTALVDEIADELLRALGPEDVLMVVSGYGLTATPPWRRALWALTGGEAPAGSHDDAPDGLILAVGGGLQAGAVTTSASILDIAPTVLYLMGLPVGRDMEGRVLTELLTTDFAQRHPVTFIPSYSSLARAEPEPLGAPIPMEEEP